jgi:XTP/dITP diphosphohydrolase
VTGRRVILATRNPGKLAELSRILADSRVQLLSLADFPGVPEVAETGVTFAENALLKAHAVSTATGLIAAADDSGLAVDVMHGMPGVLSARWSGRHGDDAANLELLLGQLADIPDDRRGASFVCAAAAATPTGRDVVVEAAVTGTLLRERHGTGGFGYDPIFVPLGETRTTAEMPAAAKDAISHRGQAFRALAPKLLALLGD